MLTTTWTHFQPSTEEKLITLIGIKQPTFKALMSDVGEGRAWIIAQAEGVLEIRIPLTEHEKPKGVIESCVEAFADALDIEVRKLCALTLELEELALAIEPHTCFYIQNESVVTGKSIYLATEPLSDLILESDYTSFYLNKFQIYAFMGVLESYKYRPQSVLMYQLSKGYYEEKNNSWAFPFLPLAEIPAFIKQSKTIGQRAALGLFRDRVREVLAH